MYNDDNDDDNDQGESNFTDVFDYEDEKLHPVACEICHFRDQYYKSFCIIDRTENYIHTLMHDFMHLLCINYVVARCNLRCSQSQHKKFQSIGSRTSTMSQLRKHMIVFHQDQVGITAKVKTQKIDQIQA